MHPRKSGLPQELVLLDFLMSRWARWARQQLTDIGWPATSMTARMIEWHELGLEPEKLYPAGKSSKAPEGVMLIDSLVAKLPEKLRKCVYVEYFHGGTNETKAKSLRMAKDRYRFHVSAALWSIYAKINEKETVCDRLLLQPAG